MEEVNAMQSLITAVQPMITQCFTMIGTVGSTIIESPYLLAGFGIFLTGGAIGLFRRMLSV